MRSGAFIGVYVLAAGEASQVRPYHTRPPASKRAPREGGRNPGPPAQRLGVAGRPRERRGRVAAGCTAYIAAASSTASVKGLRTVTPP